MESIVFTPSPNTLKSILKNGMEIGKIGLDVNYTFVMGYCKIMKKPKNWWYVWSKALGEKASSCNKTSDKVAVVRSIIFTTYLITNVAIVANAIRHWNDKTTVRVYIDSLEIQPYVTPPERTVNKPLEFE